MENIIFFPRQSTIGSNLRKFRIMKDSTNRGKVKQIREKLTAIDSIELSAASRNRRFQKSRFYSVYFST